MVEYSTRDLILLHLGSTGESKYRSTVPGISEGIGVDKSETGRGFQMFSALSEMKEEGLIEEKVEYIEELGDERNVYRLTDYGKGRYQELKDELGEKEITVKNGSNQKIKLKDVDEYMDSGGNPLVKALAELGPDDLLYLEKEFEDFVGREQELDELNQVLDEARNAQTRTVMVSGPAGIGKTTLVERAVDNTDDLTFLRGKSQPDVGRPYQPVIDAVRDIGAEDEVNRILEEFTEPEPEDEDTYDAQRTAMFNQLADRFQDYSSDTLLILFIDDLQWSDNATLELLEHMTEKLDEAPMVLVGAYRVEEIQEDDRLREMSGSSDLKLELGPLGTDDTEKIVGRILGEREVPSDFVDVVHRKTGGNPFFVEETVRKLLEENKVDLSYGIYPETVDEVSISETVESAVHKRLETLDDETRKILEKCSVIGDRIPIRLLSSLSELDGLSLMDRVDVLTGTNIWTRNSEGYRFSHDILRNSVYDGIEDRRKTEIHAEVSERIREVYEDDTENRYSEIANHYEKAEQPEKALEFYEKAGDKARDVYSQGDAVGNYKKALEIAREVGDEQKALELVESVGRSYQLTGDYDEADRYYEYVSENAEEEETRMRISAYRSEIRKVRGEIEEVSKIVDQGLELWDGGTPSEGLCRLLKNKAWVKWENGELEESFDLYERLREAAEELGDEAMIGSALNGLGLLQMYRGEYQVAEEMFEESIEVFGEMGVKHHLSDVYHNLGLLYTRKGEMHKAKEKYEKSLEISEETGNKVKKYQALHHLGVILSLTGDWDGAVEHFERALGKATETGDTRTVAAVLESTAEMYRPMGKLDEAREKYERALELYREAGNKPFESHALSNLASWHYVTNELEEALESAESALKIAEELDLKPQKSHSLSWMARVEKERGNLEKAVELGERAVEEAEEGEERNKVDARCVLVECYLETGRVDKALETAEEAVELVELTSDVLREIKSDRAIGSCYREEGELEKAEDRLVSSLEGARELGSKLDECEALRELGLLEKHREREEKAAEYNLDFEEIAEENGFEILLDG